MRTASAFSVTADTASGAGAAAVQLKTSLGGLPDIAMVYSTDNHANPDLMAALADALPGVRLIGGTSCRGVMTEAGFHSGPSGAIGLFGICDDGGTFGVGFAPVGDDPAAAGAAAMTNALADAGRDFECPTLVWCCQPPGAEESVLRGIEGVIGGRTPIIGGSSADETIAGDWRQYATGRVLDGHVVVAALFPVARHGAAFQSGYAPTEQRGVVTKAKGRQVLEIDHRPAGEVYGRWTDGAICAKRPGAILAESTSSPLGRVVKEDGGVDMFVLSHPALMGEAAELSLFTDIQEGDQIHLMRGSVDSLVKRAGMVVTDAATMGGWARDQTAGGLVIYCGGCMLHVHDRMDEVAAQIRDAMGGSPFLGAFTFGEQGAIIDNCNRHGNLMVSALAFG